MHVVADLSEKNAGWPGEEEEVVSVAGEENKALVRRFFEAHAKRDLGTLREILAPNFVDHRPLPGAEDPDRESYIQFVAERSAALSDIRFIVGDQMAAEGDRVVSRLTIRFTHDRRELVGFAPTGKEYEVTAIIIDRIEGGKIVEEWTEGSDVEEMTQARLEQEISERERIEQELQVARRIQHALLPKEVPTLEGWEISPFYRPARQVGGDFYDFLELPNEHLGLVVGDATGKGVPAALVMSSARSMLRALAQASESSPGDVLRRANDPLVMDIPSNMFVTCFYAILDPRSGRLVYANAGHDMPYLCRSSEVEELRARGMPLGLMPGMRYEEKETILEADEAALFYSDGLVEAHDPQGEMFGFPRLRALVAEHGEETSLGDFLLEKLYSFVGEGWEQEDDITLLTLRRSSARN
jgi:serine phosphatase RsbU (regulator of sigma subunit)/predicted ester cyclase